MKLSLRSEWFAAFKEKCRAHHLKMTPQRMAIYQALLEAEGHPTAEDMCNAVRDEFPNISFDTVYRTLVTFSEIGLTDIVAGHGGPRRFDTNPDNHHHFYCIGCRRIFDFESEAMDQIPIPAEIDRKCRILSKRMILKGYCHKCSAQQKKF